MTQGGGSSLQIRMGERREVEANITAPATDAAKQWAGWGTALKPAMEPITVARKPLIGTVAENVLAHGTGAINVDGCRVGTIKNIPASPKKVEASSHTVSLPGNQGTSGWDANIGRWPANLIHDGSDEVVGLFPDCKPAISRTKRPDRSFAPGTDTQTGTLPLQGDAVYRDSGSAARFFYTAKASGTDRGNRDYIELPLFGEPASAFRNTHPTVKPIELMRYLCRLVTPPRGIVLDPFMGSGSTLFAAKAEGVRAIGIEREERYCEIAARRLAQRALPIFDEAPV